jgi:hypothetical protein
MAANLLSWLPTPIQVAIRTVLIIVPVGALIVMSELDRLIVQSVAGGSSSYSLNALSGVTPFSQVGAWQVWAADPVAFPLVRLHTGVDLVFIAAYLALGVITMPGWWSRGAVILAGALDLLEDTLLWQATDGAHLAQVLPYVTLIKWGAVMVVVMFVVLDAQKRSTIAAMARPILHAMWVHRLAVVIAIMLGIIGLVPTSGVLDQLPDAQRAWSGDVGWWQPVIALAATTAMTVGAFALGRQRSQQQNALAADPGSAGAPGILYWAAPAIAALVTAAILFATGNGELVGLQTVFFIAAIVAVLAASLAIRVLAGGSAPVAPMGSVDPHTLRRVGDMAAISLVAISGLGLVRSFAAPWALADIPDAVAFELPLGMIAFWLVVGMVAALAAFPILVARTWGYDDAPAALGGADTTSTGAWIVRLALIGAGTVIVGVFALFPIAISGLFGVLGTTVFGLLGWSLVIGSATIELAGRRPLDLFRAIGLRSDPVLSFAVVVPLVLAVVALPPQLHAVERDAQAAVLDTRTHLDVALQEWIDDGAGAACYALLPDGTKVRPLVLAAAEGGGIRAATWTADVFSAVMADGACARQAVFLSSGVSGGSVGLTLFRTDDPESDPGAEPVSAGPIAEPDGLAAIIAAALTGDLLSGATGLRLPTESSRDGVGRVWQDRAGQVQSVWRQHDEAFRLAYDHERQSPTGWVVLNSTAAKENCRVLISQLDLGLDRPSTQPTANDGRAVSCLQPEPGVSGAIDLETVYGSCPMGLDWATAALLSARFGVVSPDGRIDRDNLPASCAAVPRLQLVDGGYAENSGLGTLSDIASSVVEVAAAHNATVDSGESDTWIVPMVMWVSNSPGSDIVRPPADAAPSLIVPLETLSANVAINAPSRWLQRLSDTIESPCAGAIDDDDVVTACETAMAAAHVCVDSGVAVVAPTSTPTIAAPLGWTLSKMSQDSLQSSVDALVAKDPSCGGNIGYGSFADLLSLFPSDDELASRNGP